MTRFQLGDVISYLEICNAEGMNLQRGMNFRPRGRTSIFLMNVSKNAPYSDRVEDEGKVLIYEGHNAPKQGGIKDPKRIDQELTTPTGRLTQNGLFFNAVKDYSNKKQKPEIVKVYEKLKPGIWVFNGLFRLTDAWQESSRNRKVYKFRLEIEDTVREKPFGIKVDLKHARLIPTSIKLEIWKRDNGKCVICGSIDNLHFDHIIPYSKGGSSLVAKNIQLLCARHNLQKHDRIV